MNLTISTPQNQYTFTLYPIGTNFYQIAGIYIFIILPPFTEILPSAENLETVAEALEATHNPTTINPKPITFYHLLYAGITNNFRGRFN